MELFLGVLIGIPLGVGLTVVWALCQLSAAQEKLDWEGRNE